MGRGARKERNCEEMRGKKEEKKLELCVFYVTSSFYPFGHFCVIKISV